MSEGHDNEKQERKQQYGFLSDGTGPESPEKVQSKRQKPNPGPSKAIDFNENVSQPSSGSASHSIDEKLPLWVAGSSPAKFVALDDLIKINNSIEKMAIVHEIAVDPKFSVEDLQKNDQVYDAVKRNMHKAYWDMLREDLEKGPPDYNFAFQLLKDLKEIICGQFSSGNLNNALCTIDEILDLNHLKLRFDQKMLDFRHILQRVLEVLARLCAPIRDELVQQLKAEDDLVNLFRGIFELLELMEIDMANFALSQNRGTIENYSAKIEHDEFMKALEVDPNGSHYIKLWLKYILDKSGRKCDNEAQPSSSSKQPDSGSLSSSSGLDATLSAFNVRNLIVDFYVTLLEMNPQCRDGADAPPAELVAHFPETLLLDKNRLLALGEKRLQLELVTAAIFVASNLAGKRVCESPNFKTTLKNELIVILNDVTWSNHVEKLENLFLQCEKNLKTVDPELSEEKSALLRTQIMDLKDPNNSIRNIARVRIRGFLQLVLCRGGDQIKLPPGLSSIQAELIAFTGRVYAILIHNWNAFGDLYAGILQRAHHENAAAGPQKAQKSQ